MLVRSNSLLLRPDIERAGKLGGKPFYGCQQRSKWNRRECLSGGKEAL